MQSSYEILGKLNEDRTGITFLNPHLYSDIFQPWDDKVLHMKVSKAERKRSIQQNKYFHAVIVVIVKDWLRETQGRIFTTEQSKLWIYDEIVGLEVQEVVIRDRTYYQLIGKRMSQRSTIEFNEAKEMIQQWFAQMDVRIPDPDPNYYNKLV